MSEEAMVALIQTLGPVIVSAVSTVLVWVLSEVARQVRSRTNNELAISAIDRLTHTAASTVMEIEQVVVPRLRAASADGKLSARDMELLRDLAMKKIKERVQPAVQKQAKRAISDLDGFLQSKIEQLVYSMKPTGGPHGSNTDC